MGWGAAEEELLVVVLWVGVAGAAEGEEFQCLGGRLEDFPDDIVVCCWGYVLTGGVQGPLGKQVWEAPVSEGGEPAFEDKRKGP